MTLTETDVEFSTAELCDAHRDDLQVLAPDFPSLGGNSCFAGKIYTVSVTNDNALVRQVLQRPGKGRVLVVAGRGVDSPALVGDTLATIAVANGWSGIVVDGSVRDTAALGAIKLGVRARRVFPARAWGGERGTEGEVVRFGGVTFRPGDWLYADGDGVVVSESELGPS